MRPAPLLALAATLAACGSKGSPCPGRQLATFTFRTATASATCGAASAPCGVAFPSLAPFSATVTVDATGTVAWLCTGRPLAEPLEGTLTGDALDVSYPAASAAGVPAVLAACGAACAVTLRERVAGTILRGSGGEVVGFTGSLADTADTAGAASCGPCDASCGTCDASCATCVASCGTCGTPAVVTYPLVAP